VTRALVTVLYEDSGAGGELANFGPHNLLVRCVADDLSRHGVHAVEFYALRREMLVGRPMNSNSKVQAECARISKTLARNGSIVVALYDFDKVHRLIPSVGARRCKGEMRNALRQQSDAPDSLRVYFLDRNVETLTTATARLLGVTLRGKPKPAERDGLLNPIALAEGVEACDRRSHVRSEVQTFDYVVRRVAELVVALSTGAAP
jgi:hypothetical protein